MGRVLGGRLAGERMRMRIRACAADAGSRIAEDLPANFSGTAGSKVDQPYASAST